MTVLRPRYDQLLLFLIVLIPISSSKSTRSVDAACLYPNVKGYYYGQTSHAIEYVDCSSG